MNDSNVIGAILGAERTRLSLTISKVCDGLCSSSTYNRYEGGKMLPDKFMLSALLERMGKNPNRVVYTVTDEEQRLLDIRSKILSCVKDGDIEKLTEYYYEYSEIPKTRCKNIHRQFELEVRGALFRLKGDEQSALALYREALEQTCKKKDFGIINDTLYTSREFNLLYKLGMIGDFDLLFKLGFYLKNLNDNHYLKVVFYGNLIADLVAKSADRWKKQMQLEYIEEAIGYKRRIRQSNGIVRLLELKENNLGELSADEKILLNMDSLLG